MFIVHSPVRARFAENCSWPSPVAKAQNCVRSSGTDQISGTNLKLQISLPYIFFALFRMQKQRVMREFILLNSTGIFNCVIDLYFYENTITLFRNPVIKPVELISVFKKMLLKFVICGILLFNSIQKYLFREMETISYYLGMLRFIRHGWNGRRYILCKLQSCEISSNCMVVLLGCFNLLSDVPKIKNFICYPLII